MRLVAAGNAREPYMYTGAHERGTGFMGSLVPRPPLAAFFAAVEKKCGAQLRKQLRGET